jgi:hypothetical protein
LSPEKTRWVWLWKRFFCSGYGQRNICTQFLSDKDLAALATYPLSSRSLDKKPPFKQRPDIADFVLHMLAEQLHPLGSP